MRKGKLFATGFVFALYILLSLCVPQLKAQAASWPSPPQISSEGAILMDAETGIVLYEKNADTRLYPASTTKILTTLIASESAALTDEVYFSESAVNSVPADGSKIGIDAGEHMSMEDCLYGILVGSANEVSNAVGEHVAGSVAAFTDRMNERAAELGCTNSHFVNTNGLHDDEHYTTPRDLATIGRAFFASDILCRISGTARYHFEPSEGQPDDIYIINKHRLVSGEMPYEGTIGGKTGYTSNAQETLVTCAEQNGMKLICVVMKAPSPEQFNDTVTLFDYGFRNFQRISAADEASPLPDVGTLYSSGEMLPDLALYTLSLDTKGAVILPQGMSLSDAEVSVRYPEAGEAVTAPDGSKTVAVLTYLLDGRGLGSMDVRMKPVGRTSLTEDEASLTPTPRTVYVNLYHVLFAVLSAALLVILLILSRRLSRSFRSGKDRRRYLRRRREIKKRRGL